MEIKMLVLGHGRHGKDAVADILREDYNLSCASSSLVMLPIVREVLEKRGIRYSSEDECYDDRINHRAMWKEIISDYVKDDKSRLAREILKRHDAYIGMRCQLEYAASKHLFTNIFWVDASERGIGPDQTMTIRYDPDCMRVIDNNGSLADLRDTVMEAMGHIAMSKFYVNRDDRN